MLMMMLINRQLID